MLVNKPLHSGTVRRGRRRNGCWCSSFSCQTWKIWETHLKEAQRNYWLKEYMCHAFAKCHKSFKINWHATHRADDVRLVQPFHNRWDVLLLKLQVPLILLNYIHFCETRTHHTTSTTKCTYTAFLNLLLTGDYHETWAPAGFLLVLQVHHILS